MTDILDNLRRLATFGVLTYDQSRALEALLPEIVAEIERLNRYIEILLRDQKFMYSHNERISEDHERLNRDIKWLRDAAMLQSHGIEQTLGKALGYPKLYPEASDVDDGTVCVGDHVPETLATEAAKEIERLRAENATLRAKLARGDDVPTVEYDPVPLEPVKFVPVRYVDGGPLPIMETDE